MTQTTELYKRITGVDPPKPFTQKTHEERLRDRDKFIAAVNDSDDDDAVDELLEYILMDRRQSELHSIHDRKFDAA